MHRYTILCTDKQVKFALELGAPLHPTYIRTGCKVTGIYNDGKLICKIPSAEQMIGWLEKHGIDIATPKIKHNNTCKYMCHVTNSKFQYLGNNELLYKTKKEAIITAIDIALEYLNTNKTDK